MQTLNADSVSKQVLSIILDKERGHYNQREEKNDS